MATDATRYHWRTATSSRLWVALAAGLPLALALTLLLPPSSVAVAKGCSVKNEATGQAYGTLQAAVDAAVPGDAFIVLGACRGTTIIDKDLTIKGAPGRGKDRASLDGEDENTVVSVEEGVTLLMSNLVIKHGLGDPLGGGVRNLGTLVLDGVRVRQNKGGQGGGIRNEGSLTLQGDTRVSDNEGLPEAGGVYNVGSLTLNDSATIRGNEGSLSGGVTNFGTLTMNDASSIDANEVYDTGGGVTNHGTLTMNDVSSIAGNRAHQGAGVMNLGRLILTGSSAITGNRARWAGGVFNEEGATMELRDGASIRDNNGGTIGGGVVNYGILNLTDDSEIIGNWTRKTSGTGTVCGPAGGANGGGVFNHGTITMTGSSSISENVSGYGGGVDNSAEVVMHDQSAIRDNRAASLGGGVYNDPGSATCPRGSLTMTEAASIVGNQAGESGGGVVTGGAIQGLVCAPESDANVHANTPDDCYSAD